MLRKLKHASTALVRNLPSLVRWNGLAGVVVKLHSKVLFENG